jgi:hypothetical protein
MLLAVALHLAHQATTDALVSESRMDMEVANAA